MCAIIYSENLETYCLAKADLKTSDMKNNIPALILVIGYVFTLGCSESNPVESSKPAVYSSLGEELNKEVVMIRVDSLPETMPTMFYVDAFGSRISTVPGKNWYALVKASQQLIPVNRLIHPGHKDMRRSFDEFSQWIDDPNRGRLYYWSIIGQSATVEVGKFPNHGCYDCDIKVLMTGNQNWDINGSLSMSKK